MPDLFSVALCDGSTIVIRQSIADEFLLRAAITRGGEEMVDIHKWDANVRGRGN